MLYLVAELVVGLPARDGALGHDGMRAEGGAEERLGGAAHGALAITARLGADDAEALVAVGAGGIQQDAPAISHAAVHIGAPIDGGRRHEDGHGGRRAHFQSQVVGVFHIGAGPGDGLAGVPIHGLDMHLGRVGGEGVPVEGHGVAGGRVLDQLLVKVRAVEVAGAPQEAAPAAEARVLHQIDEGGTGTGGVAHQVVHRMAGSGRDAVDAPEVQVAREQLHHHAGSVAVAHAAALEDERHIGLVDGEAGIFGGVGHEDSFEARKKGAHKSSLSV